jgi:hypothetical protein
MSEQQATKIYVTSYQDGEYWIGSALGEDGQGLANHLSSNKIWVRHDMGLTGKWKHDKYAAAYPNGFELVDLVDATNDELFANEEYMTALRINQQQQLDEDRAEAESHRVDDSLLFKDNLPEVQP